MQNQSQIPGHVSMEQFKQLTYPIIGKMNKDSENAAQKIRDFKKVSCNDFNLVLHEHEPHKHYVY